MATILDKDFWDIVSDTSGSLQGKYREQIGAHNDTARKHFLEYCDSGKCIRGCGWILSRTIKW